MNKNISFKIGKKIINNKRTFIIAEISSNHNNSLKRAVSLIKKAKKIGADAVKLQTYKADTITLKSNKRDFSLSHLKNKSWKKYKYFYDIYKHGSIPWNWHKKLFDLAKKINIEIFSSPFDETAVDMLEKLNCVAYKIASAEVNHIPLLIRVAKTGKPVIISSGLSLENDLDLAIKTLKKYGCKKIIILKCNSSYPAPLKESNLNNIKYLIKKYKLPVGLSDHSIGDISAITAVSLGASVIEKHFNLDDKVKTLDSFFSSGEKEFKNMIKKIRDVENILGDFKYKLSNSSIKNLRAKRSIYVSKNLKVNEKITTSNIKVVRPGYGLHPKYYFKVIGMKVKKNLEKGTRLKLEFIKK